MCYWDLLDNLSLSELFEFLEYRNSYKDMITSAEDIIAKKESKSEYEKEESQLKYLEEKEKQKNGK